MIVNMKELEAAQDKAIKEGSTNKFLVINSTTGDLHVHRLGCADIKRREIQKQGINSMWISEAPDEDTLVKNEVKQLNEDFGGEEAFSENNFVVYPCARKMGREGSKTVLMHGASKEALAADTEQSDREYIAQHQNKVAKKKSKKTKSKTSGWSKLKEELPSSNAVKARLLAEGGHSDGYRKVLESLEKYWTKRGK